MIWLARACTTFVTSVSAGPPLGGLYLKPPSCGGLWLGVITIPSATPSTPARLCSRMAWLIRGVGVNRPGCTRTRTPLAIRTSSAVIQAGSDRACVSRPMYSGPVIPACARYSATACAMARMCVSLKVPAMLLPRWPLVPNATRCRGSLGSGRVS